MTDEQIDVMEMALLQQHELHPLTPSAIRQLCAQARSSAAGGAEPAANGWKYQIQTGYIHQGCGACWQVHFNDTGLYALCPSCDERRSIDPTFPPIVYAHPSVAGMPDEALEPDLMLYGTLRMPYEMAMGDELSRNQYWQRAQQALDELDKLRAYVRALGGA